MISCTFKFKAVEQWLWYKLVLNKFLFLYLFIVRCAKAFGTWDNLVISDASISIYIPLAQLRYNERLKSVTHFISEQGSKVGISMIRLQNWELICIFSSLVLYEIIFGKFGNVCQWLDTNKRGISSSIFLDLILNCASDYAWIFPFLDYFKAITIKSKPQLKLSSFNQLCFFQAFLIVDFCELLFASRKPSCA